MQPLLRTEKNRFILRLSKSIYKKDILDKALKEDNSWVKTLPGDKLYHCLAFDTTDKNDVLEWVNYLFYLNKTS